VERRPAAVRAGAVVLVSLDVFAAPPKGVLFAALAAADLAETLRFAVAQRLPLRGLAAGLMEMRRYAAVRRAAPLNVLPPAAWAAEAGLTLRVAPANLTFGASRCCAVPTRE
jgi:hypothetical protein